MNDAKRGMKRTYKDHAQTAFVHCHSMRKQPLWT